MTKMGRKARMHAHTAIVTLFDWQHELMKDAVAKREYMNHRDILEDGLLQLFKRRDTRCAELLETKKVVRQMWRKSRKKQNEKG